MGRAEGDPDRYGPGHAGPVVRGLGDRRLLEAGNSRRHVQHLQRRRRCDQQPDDDRPQGPAAAERLAMTAPAGAVGTDQAAALLSDEDDLPESEYFELSLLELSL